MKIKRRTSPGKRARRRQKAEINRLRREIGRLAVRLDRKNVANGCGEGVGSPEAAMIYDSEVEAIKCYVQAYPSLETGGSLYGWYSETGLPIIALVTGPGPKAQHHETHFHADEGYSLALGNFFVEHGLQHLGEWHSHHTLRLNRPSGIDCNAMRAALTSSDSARRILCGIANIENGAVTFNVFYFSKNSERACSHTPLVAKRGMSPLRVGLQDEIAVFERKGVVS